MGTEQIKSKVLAKFADRLQDLISDSGKQIRELSSEIGISSGSLSKYQNDSAEAGISALYLIADYFNVSIDWLLGRPNSIKTIDADKSAIAKYTGLSLSNIEWLHSLLDDAPKLRMLNAFLENVVFRGVLNDAIELEKAQLKTVIEQFEPSGVNEGPIKGAQIVSDYDYCSLLEYRMSEYLKSVIWDITSPSEEKMETLGLDKS